MTLSLGLACIWAVLANITAMLPSRRRHWPQAWVLIALGLPLLVYVFWENGPLVGVVVLAAGASVLRWPLRYLWASILRSLRG